MTSRRLAPIAAAVALAGALGSCSKHTTPFSPSTVRTLTPTVAKIEILGANRLTAVDAVSQLTARITLSDGTSQDYTSRCSWSSTDRAVATVTNGLVKAASFGRTVVEADCGLADSHVLITVVPPNTYVLSGEVTEPGALQISGATVEIVAGPDAGKAATTTTTGFFAFYGVSGDLQIRFSKDGYIAKTIPLRLDQDATENVELQPSVPPATIGGDYRVMLRAGAGCQLPEEATVREYSAHVTEVGARIDVRLTGAELEPGLADQGFSGRIAGSRLTLDIIYDDYYGLFSVLEKLSDTEYLTFYGTATGDVQAGTIPATLSGTIAIYAGPPVRVRFKADATCTGTHQLTFVSSSTTSNRRR